MTWLRCPICGEALQTCGQDHMTLPPVDIPPAVKDTTMTDEAPELQEYHYHIGFIEHTALLTPELAEKLGAKPIDEPLDDPNINTNEQHRGNVQAAGELKARTARNKRQ